MNKKRKLKRSVCFILGFITAIVLMLVVKVIRNNWNNWFQECDNHYGYQVDYYTCRQYHLNK